MGRAGCPVLRAKTGWTSENAAKTEGAERSEGLPRSGDEARAAKVLVWDVGFGDLEERAPVSSPSGGALHRLTYSRICALVASPALRSLRRSGARPCVASLSHRRPPSSTPAAPCLLRFHTMLSSLLQPPLPFSLLALLS